MKTKPKILWVLLGALIGFIAGASASALYVGIVSNQVIKNMAISTTLEHLYYAELLRAQEPEKVLTLLEETLPASIRWFKAFDYSDENSLEILQRIKEYYEKHGLEIPEEIKLLLEKQPNP